MSYTSRVLKACFLFGLQNVGSQKAQAWESDLLGFRELFAEKHSWTFFFFLSIWVREGEKEILAA